MLSAMVEAKLNETKQWSMRPCNRRDHRGDSLCYGIARVVEVGCMVYTKKIELVAINIF